MLLIPCPFCGEREETEFHCGGEAHIQRPRQPSNQKPQKPLRRQPPTRRPRRGRQQIQRPPKQPQRQPRRPPSLSWARPKACRRR